MEQAREMLRVSRLSIKEICLASGFRDRHHFTRLFAKIHGCPPNTYRETGRRIG
jgi:two-component system response regulator YesN